MKILAMCTLLCATASFASTEHTTKPGYVACETRSHLDQIKKAADNDDSAVMAELLTHGCYITNPGFTVVVLERADKDKLKIRLNANADPVDLWTYEGNIN